MNNHIMLITIFMAFIGLTGFNIENAIVPQNHIFSGGPPKDDIPAILQLKFLKPNQATFLTDSDHVIGVQIGNKAKAYPIKILNWYEVVNDTLNGQPIAVTF